MSLIDDAPVFHFFEDVSFTHPCDTLHFLTNLDNWFKKIICEGWFCIRTGFKLFVDCHCADIFWNPTVRWKELFVQVASRWSSYEGGCLLFASTPSVSSYHSSLELLTERLSLLFCIAIAELCVYALMSFFLSALLGVLVDVTHDLKVDTTLAESVLLLALPSSVHKLVCGVGLFSIHQGS